MVFLQYGLLNIIIFKEWKGYWIISFIILALTLVETVNPGVNRKIFKLLSIIHTQKFKI